MSLRTRIAGWLSGRSLATTLAWQRGDDVVDRPANRIVSPYAQSPWVHAAVNLVSGEFSGLPLDFYAGEEAVEEPALASWWREPALGPGRQRLDRATVDRWLSLWLLTEGEFFLLLDDAWGLPKLGGGAASLRTPFVVAVPSRVRLLVQGGELQGYDYTDSAGRRTVYLPEQVVHVMEPNPLDDWRGLGRAQVARVATEGAFLTGAYLRDLMRNNGDQGFIIIGKGGVADDAQRDQIAAQLRAKRNSLRAGVARDLFLTGDLTIDRPKEQAASADLSATLAATQQEIFVAFGVPPSLATVKQSYSVGKESDRYQLITATAQPIARLIAGAYARLATRQAGRPLTAEHCWDEHPILQQVRRDRLDAGLKLWASGMSWRDINAYLDLGMAGFPGWEVAYLPFSVAPVSGGDAAPSPRDPAADPSLAEGTPADPQLASLRLLLLARARAARPVCQIENPKSKIENEFAAFACACGDGEGESVPRAATPLQLAEWRTHMAARRSTVGAFKSAFGRVLMAARTETLRKLEAQHLDPTKLSSSGPSTFNSQLSTTQRNVASDLLFTLERFTVAFRGAMETQHKAALATSGAQLLREVGHLDPYQSPPVVVQEFLAARENRLRGVPQSVFDRVRAQLQEGLDAGESTAQLAARVKRAFNALADDEAKRIALTETSAAYGAGRQFAMKQAGIRYKAWLTSGNANVRAAHEQAGLDYPPERAIPVDEPFIVDGEPLMHPGDTAGSARNVINCHCISLAVRPPGEDEGETEA